MQLEPTSLNLFQSLKQAHKANTQQKIKPNTQLLNCKPYNLDAFIKKVKELLICSNLLIQSANNSKLQEQPIHLVIREKQGT